MVSSKTAATTASRARKPKEQRLSKADRSSYFARREAAKVLQCVLQGDAKRRAVGSIKSLVYSPSVRNKKATFALVCQTLKHLSIIKDVLDSARILNAKWKRQEGLMYIITYDILFGQEISSVGDAEKFLLLQKDAIQLALARLLVRKKVKRVEDLMALYQIPDVSKPRFVRVNTLKLDVESAFHELGKQNMVQKDDMVPDLLILHQGKASSMVAVALGPEPGWEVLDACSAPGNKTVHLAALMNGKGKIIACELDNERVKRLEDTVRLSGAASILSLAFDRSLLFACVGCLCSLLSVNFSLFMRLFMFNFWYFVLVDLTWLIDIEVLHGDFLNLNPMDPSYSKVKFRGLWIVQGSHIAVIYLQVRAILLDPSCSGSGTTAERLDHLLPSYAAGSLFCLLNYTGDATDVAGTERLNKLAAFQKKALEHALSFPAVEKVVYSTCSIHQIENEDVIKSVLPLAASHGFQLATPFPQWPRRGLPVFEGSEHLLRTDPVEDKEGFFIALFVRKSIARSLEQPIKTRKNNKVKSAKRNATMNHNKSVMPFPFTRLSKLLLHSHLRLQTYKKLNMST
ncbi:putative 28S rRNA (cytosine-C(5))-methyltransferase [Vitis vinifera]|uniref:Putative 28S rRNA (Cytosine-C(5))-methyltransferase n=1 Tax=Vitis vinifera TaxID=29760 RepID=A0A438EXG6_VITVI|nr:putative 28S rRNA (cytosine-C(5))-methyltransferase [Vitis vinifera]